jgi:hypothetical protein
LVQEPYLDADAAVVVRARTRWRCAGTLADTGLHRFAFDEPAIRLAGDGPRRGHVAAVSADELWRRAGGASVSVAHGDYALVAGSRLVVAYRGQQALRELQIASGVLTVANHRNRLRRQGPLPDGRSHAAKPRQAGPAARWGANRARLAPRASDGGSDVTSVPGWRLSAPRLRFDAAFPSRAGAQAYQGVRAHGPFDSSRVVLGEGTLLFVFPQAMQAQARRLAEAWLRGVGSFPGFEAMFRVPVATGQALKSLPVAADLTDLSVAASAYRRAISAWSAQQRDADPLLALVLVPHSERWQTNRPYDEAKAAFANLGIPSQMVTTELIDDGRFGWAVADIALASFAKLGGIPWTVEAPTGDDDLIIGIGRRDVGPEGRRRRIFGYAVTFISNGVYRQTWSFTPAADEATYLQRLQEAVQAALTADLEAQPQTAGHPSIKSHRSPRDRSGPDRNAQGRRHAARRLPAPGRHDPVGRPTLTRTPGRPPKASSRGSGRRALLHAEELTATGPPDGPLLVELDERSTVDEQAFDKLVGQVFRLAHANWRGFNARSKPATLVYGEELAGLVGHLADVETWNPDLLRSDLRNRPWFL